jgi:hypothetical protein
VTQSDFIFLVSALLENQSAGTEFLFDVSSADDKVDEQHHYFLF